jgi:PiT family inorganic phosphate transporter
MNVDTYGLPGSTTRVLSSAIAVTMAANGSGLRGTAARQLAMARLRTPPAAILLSGGPRWLSVHPF